jgi:hypothetical protein
MHPRQAAMALKSDGPLQDLMVSARIQKFLPVDDLAEMSMC